VPPAAEPASPIPEAVPVAVPLGQAIELVESVPLMESVPLTDSGAPEPPAQNTFSFEMQPPAGKPKRRLSGRVWPWIRYAAVLVLVVVALLIALISWRVLPKYLRENREVAGDILEFPQLNCKFIKPGSPWEPGHGNIKASMKACLVMQRPEPEASWLALVAQDFKDHTPSAAELKDEAVRLLGNYFNKDNLEMTSGDTRLAGLKAQLLVFRGETEDNPMSGECAMVASHGIAYWFVTWAPAGAAETIQAEFAKLRDRLGLMNERKHWREPPRVENSFHGHALDYSLRDSPRIWREWMPASDFDAAADMALVARDPSEAGGKQDQNTSFAASILFLESKGGQPNLSAALKAAQSLLEAQQKAVYPETRIETVEQKESTDKAEDLGGLPCLVWHLHVINGEKRHRYVMLGAIDLPGTKLIFECECAWDVRADWRPRFMRVLETFQSDDSKKSADP